MRKADALDGFVDEDGRGVGQLTTDVEHVREPAEADTEHAAMERVQRRQTTEHAVRLTAVARIEVVAGLQITALPLPIHPPISC